MDEQKISSKKYGNLIIENRQKLSVTGVNDIESFDSGKIVLITQEGLLTVTGSEMKVKKMSSESGEAFIEGNIDGCMYLDSRREKESFLRRVLK